MSGFGNLCGWLPEPFTTAVRRSEVLSVSAGQVGVMPYDRPPARGWWGLEIGDKVWRKLSSWGCVMDLVTELGRHLEVGNCCRVY